MRTPPGPTSYVRELEVKNFDLQQQLTAALAERDEARERANELEGKRQERVVNLLAMYRHFWKDLPPYVKLGHEDAGALTSMIDDLLDRVEIAEQNRADQLDTAWQQGAEAFREAAVTKAQTLDRWANPRSNKRDHVLIADAIRALPVPERKEG